MTLQEKTQSIKSIINSSQYDLLKKIREDRERINSLINKLTAEFDMPSEILRDLRDDNDLFFNVLANNKIIDINFSLNNYKD